MLKNATFCSTLLVMACAVSVSAHAIADVARNVDVPAGDLTVALRALAKQSGVEFVYSAERLKGVHTIGVRGEYTAEQAVTKLLEGTELKLTVHPTGALLISDVTAGAPASGVGSESSSQLRLAQATVQPSSMMRNPNRRPNRIWRKSSSPRRRRMSGCRTYRFP